MIRAVTKGLGGLQKSEIQERTLNSQTLNVFEIDPNAQTTELHVLQAPDVVRKSCCAALSTAGVTVLTSCSFMMDEHYSVDNQRAQSGEKPQSACCGAQGEGSVRGRCGEWVGLGWGWG